MLPFVVASARHAAEPVTRAKSTQKASGDFATHLSAAREQMIERRANRHHLAAKTAGAHDDWAVADHVKVHRPTVRAPGTFVRATRHKAPAAAAYVPEAPSMPAPMDNSSPTDLSAYPRPL